MSLICIVCRESLTSNPVSGQENDWDGQQGDAVPSILVTKCGHAYHEFCLSKWFESSGTQDCPYCKTLLRTAENRKIFAVGDEDFGEKMVEARLVDRFGDVELATLRDENAQVHSFLKDCHQTLEAEQMAHDTLKFEYACQESNFATLKTDLSNAQEKIAQLQVLNTGMNAQILEMEATKTMCLGKIKKSLSETQVYLDACLGQNDNEPHDFTSTGGSGDSLLGESIQPGTGAPNDSGPIRKDLQEFWAVTPPCIECGSDQDSSFAE